jgi:hypothetical protein
MKRNLCSITKFLPSYMQFYWLQNSEEIACSKFRSTKNENHRSVLAESVASFIWSVALVQTFLLKGRNLMYFFTWV